MILTIDFETYYDKDYTLKKLTTEEYVRHPKFEIIGVSVKRGDDPAEWFWGAKKEIGEWLRQFNWENNSCLAHNTMFDAAILAWHFGIYPKFLLDTLSMGQALVGATESLRLEHLVELYGVGKKGDYVYKAEGKRRLDFTLHELYDYGVYCNTDVELTKKLFDAMRPFPKFEFFIIDLTLRMFVKPLIVLDTALLEDHLKDVNNHRQALINRVLLGGDVEETLKSIRSDAKFAELLRAHGVDPPTKISKTTGKVAYAFAKTDTDFQALLEHEKEEIRFLCEARLGLKTSLEVTRTERFIDISRRGSLPVPLRYYAAHTGRWGGTDNINLQNLPERGKSHKLKNSLMAPPGYVIAQSDSSQIEARILAWIAGQQDIVDLFAQGQDVYKQMAARIYAKYVGDITPEERFFGKTVVLGAGYGMGPTKFQLMVKQQGRSITLSEANTIVYGYRRNVPMIERFWDKMDSTINNLYQGMTGATTFQGGWIIENVLNLLMVGIELPNGMVMKYKNLRHSRDGWIYDTRKGVQKIYGGKLTENVVQALARCVIAEQMILISRHYPVVLTVHDAIVTLLPKSEADDGLALMKQIMSTAPAWAKGLPLSCEGEYDERY